MVSTFKSVNVPSAYKKLQVIGEKLLLEGKQGKRRSKVVVAGANYTLSR